ncbi:GntR family transcriptional regulator [Sphaerisporangium melleum]|uniref:GntR family transcriptional regulator n=1 Tax=Sphaerisporangium melleum TaxID=321316 RepID=A0A917QT46_9ACTN|nr:GntR family transcriptional regulator [Sphaerisporangium melleum]GGK66328.1 GntR family transcriptional regulator [Sphaerisporangium melleum]GII68616.1 GntR family transcriptional regulator [Sphaerisporangium melleum]
MYDISEEPVLRPVARSITRTDLVADSIRTAILSGRIKPGETLVERRLAEQLGVSKTPVREALIGLASTGLVVISPNRGVSVRAPDAADLRKAQELRLLLEPWAVACAVRVRGAGPLEDARKALGEAHRLLSGEDPTALSMANRRFHRALYAGCDNELVTAQLDNLQDLTALGTVSVLWRHWPTWRDEHAEHEEMLAAAENGDAALAERLSRTHVKRTVAHLAHSQNVT